MRVYLGKDRHCMAQHLTATHATVTELTRKIGHGHILYTDNLFSSPELIHDFTKKKINCCGTVRLNRKGMLEDLICKTVKLRQGGHSSKNLGRLDSNTVDGQERSAC
jgi:hypothetical protein